MKPSREVGMIGYEISSLDGQLGWFVVETMERGYPCGRCFFGRAAWIDGGVLYNLDDTTFVAEEAVPDEVWAALAKWRLMQ